MMTPPVGSRSYSSQLVKNCAEIALVTKAHFLRDVCDGLIRTGKERLCALYTAVIEITSKRPANHLSEEIHEIRFG
jgi:hypothetical protein